MTPASLEELEPQPKGMGEASRLTGVFFEPAKTFEDIAARPSWVVPMLLVILSALAFVFSMATRIGFDRVVDQQMQSRMAQMTSDQRAQAEKGVEMQKKFAPVGWYAGSVIAPPIVGLVCSGVLLGIFSGILSAPVKFKQVFSIFWYSAMPSVISAILTIVVIFLKPPDDFNIRNPLAFNPGAFLDPTTTSKFLFSVATSLDVFMIWRLILLAVGLKAAGGKQLSMGSAMFGVFLPWVILVLIGATFASMFG